jgi:hypothetical protein
MLSLLCQTVDACAREQLPRSSWQLELNYGHDGMFNCESR